MTVEERKEYLKEYYQKNKERIKAKAKKWYDENPQTVKERSHKRWESGKVKAYRDIHYVEVKAFLNNFKKTHPCIVCGENEPAVLVFHHLELEKKRFTIGEVENYSLKTIEREIAKCVVLCANDHAKLHAGKIDLDDYIGGIYGC